MFPDDNKDELKNTENIEPTTPELTPIVPAAAEAEPVTYQADNPPTINPLQSSTPVISMVASKKRGKKRVILVSALIFLVIVGFGGYVFAFFIPSKPENVFLTALDRSGQGFDTVVTKVTNKAQLDRFKKGEFNGTANVNYPPLKIDGKLDLKYDNSRLDFNTSAVVSEDGQTEKTYKAQVLTDIKNGSTYPDIYFIINGINQLGLESLVPGIEKLDNTWIKVDEKYLKDTVEQYQSLLTSGGDTDVTKDPPKLTNDDVTELSKLSSSLIREYILTKDSSKGILVNKSFSGKEKTDGLNTYHYVIGINKDNYVTACIDSSNRLFDSTAYRRLTSVSEDDVKKTKEEAKKGCEDSKKDIKDDETFDLWVDGKYKLIYKIRVVSDGNSDESTEIGQKYSGDDDLHFFVNYENKKDKTTGKFTLDINTKSLVSKIKLTADTLHSDTAGKFEISIDGKPLDSDISIDKPTNPKSIKDVIKELGLGSGEEILSPIGLDTSDPFSLDPGL